MARQLHHTGCLKEPCFLYESTFKHSELEKEQFHSVACQLDFTTVLELFNNFKEVLTSTAEENGRI
eukprot:14197986-Ditylum_brightwellii.AAC.1